MLILRTIEKINVIHQQYTLIHRLINNFVNRHVSANFRKIYPLNGFFCCGGGLQRLKYTKQGLIAGF